MRSGATDHETAPVLPVVSVRTMRNPRRPAGRVEIATRTPASGVPLPVATKRMLARLPARMEAGPCAASRRTAGSATANCQLTGPATLPALSAAVTETVCTPALRVPGA